jgi:inorganic pyrophosphatase/solute carrier family 25 iron transporter 28/37
MIMSVVRDTLKAEGIRGLYKGFGVHVCGSIPAAGLYFGSYELFKT